MVRPRFLVIGAGPSGLVSAKVLSEQEFNGEKADVSIVEEGDRIGGTFVNKAYEFSTLVSSKYNTCFSDFREDSTCHDHPSIPSYVEYLERYSSRFELSKIVRFRVRVVNVQSSDSISPTHKKFHQDINVNTNNDDRFNGIGSRKHKVTFFNMSTGKTYLEIFDAVAICSGLHNVPRIPHFKGQDKFQGMMFHSSDYKNPFQLPLPQKSNGAKIQKTLTERVALKENKENVPGDGRKSAARFKSPTKSDVNHTARTKTSHTTQSFFEGKRVLVIGCGETGFDLAYDAAAHNAHTVAMLSRHGFVSVPASLPHMPPLDCLIMNVGTHAYDSHFAAKHNLHWWITTKFQRVGLLLMGGSSFGLNQWAGRSSNMSWDRGNKYVVNKSGNCMGLINRSVKANMPLPIKFLDRCFFSSWEKSSAGVGPEEGVKLFHPYEVDQFDDDGTSIHLRPTTESEGITQKYAADVVVLATGYVQKFPFLQCEGQPEDPLPSEHYIIDPHEPTIAYIGFVRPNVGSIPPMAELQAMWWCTRLKHQESMFVEAPEEASAGKVRQKARELRRQRLCGAGRQGDLMPGPTSKPYYKLHGSRLPYAVDYGTYMFALAREMGSVPRLGKWCLSSPKVFAAAAFGQAHVPLFRLDGPFAHPDAAHICETELLRPILQRPLFMNCAFAANALFFGCTNLILSLLSRMRRYTVEDFVADCVDASYDVVDLFQASKVKLLEHSKMARFWYIKFEKYFNTYVYRPYFQSSHNRGQMRKTNSEVDWLAAWLVSKKHSKTVITMPSESAPIDMPSRKRKAHKARPLNGIAQGLRCLSEMREAGHLTEEEFITAKTKLLS